MIDFSGFKVFNFSEGSPYVSITKNGITFNRGVVMKLDCPTYVRLLINNELKQILIQVCNEDDENSAVFFSEGKKAIAESDKKNATYFVRWNGRDLINTIKELMDWDLRSNSYKVFGTLYEDEKAMIFDLTKAVKMNK